MKQIFTLTRVAVFIMLLNCHVTAQTRGYSSDTGADNSVEDVSLLQLISSPAQFHGKRVRFIGFLKVEFEGNAIYLHREDFDYAIERDAVWIDLPAEMTKAQKDAVDLHYVICTGIFNAKAHGHMGSFAGEIQDVRRLELWADRPRPEHVGAPSPAKK